MAERQLSPTDPAEFQRRGRRIHDRGLSVGCALDKFAATSQLLFVKRRPNTSRSNWSSWSNGSRLLCSFVPAQPDKPDYDGESWVGRSHESGEKGTVAHDPETLLAECRAAGLSPYLLRQATDAQLWIYCEPRAMGPGA